MMMVPIHEMILYDGAYSIDVDDDGGLVRRNLGEVGYVALVEMDGGVLRRWR